MIPADENLLPYKSRTKRSENLERMIKPELSFRTDSLSHLKGPCHESRGANRKHLVLRARIVTAIGIQEVFLVQSRSDSFDDNFGGRNFGDSRMPAFGSFAD